MQAFFWLYRAALLAETQKQTSRANFYWKEADLIARGLTKKPERLSVALKAFAAANHLALPEHTGDIDKRFVSETVIDGHLAAYNALESLDDVQARQRRDFHVSQMAKWLSRTSLTPRERLSLLRPAIRRSAQLAVESKRWDDMVKQYRLGLSLDPEDSEFQSGLANALFARVMSGLKSDTTGESARREAKDLAATISELEVLAMSKPLVADHFDILIKLYTTLAVRLANAQKYAEALEAAEKAYVISSQSDEVNTLKKQLNEIMESVQKRAAELVKMVKSTPNARLTAEGISLKQQAKIGFDLAKRFALSERATQLAAAADQARARRIWIALGLPEAAGNLETDVALLNSAILQILSENLKSIDEIESNWKAVALKSPSSQALTRER